MGTLFWAAENQPRTKLKVIGWKLSDPQSPEGRTKCSATTTLLGIPLTACLKNTKTLTIEPLQLRQNNRESIPKSKSHELLVKNTHVRQLVAELRDAGQLPARGGSARRARFAVSARLEWERPPRHWESYQRRDCLIA